MPIQIGRIRQLRTRLAAGRRPAAMVAVWPAMILDPRGSRRSRQYANPREHGRLSAVPRVTVAFPPASVWEGGPA
jgi:hypothetical protein